MNAPLTARQSEILAYIQQRIATGVPPTFREIALAFGINSPNGVAGHLKALERKGLITREANLSRSIRIVEAE